MNEGENEYMDALQDEVKRLRAELAKTKSETSTRCHWDDCPHGADCVHVEQVASSSYYVVKHHSHTDRQMLWKVMTRAFKRRQLAENWVDFLVSENPKGKFIVVEVREQEKCGDGSEQQ